MDKPTLDFNPFPEKETILLTDDERRLLFTRAKTADEEALNTLVAEYVPIVESTVLQLQPKNIPAKYTFTELYDTGVAALKRAILTDDEKRFDRFVVWWIRQGVLKVLMT